MRKAAQDFDDYFQDFPPEVQARLESMRTTIQAAAPEASEAISYAIPTYKLRGKNLVHFAGYAKHIGFYPGSKALELFAAELGDYKTSKGTVQFPHDRPLPLELVTRMVEWCKRR
ncbi:MAG: DUF1801 domain-containing protein [Candidatus Eremiobacteraeota bacterium]|nr:DUF1801 domain-containing protein [Candidatus Eremiobacteraeota bacterium]MCW5870190.1 DUF1801 domain-containing protein [Candidatus Eremiobacteraeota bacterium]